MKVDIKKQLQFLDLGDLVNCIEDQEMHAMLYIEKSFHERLEILLENLIALKETKLITKLINAAGFKYKEASIEGIDYSNRKFDKSLIINLMKMSFVDSSTNLIITGPTGSGKTYLGCAIGKEGCKNKYRTLYLRCTLLTKKLDDLSSDQKAYRTFLKKLSRYEILILDEWLTFKAESREVKFFYELFENRYDTHPTILISQYSSDEWHERLGGGNHADSIMDRIIHNSYEVPATQENIRRKMASEKANKLKELIE